VANMRALALFKPTFQRLQKTLEQGEYITKNVLPKTYGLRGFGISTHIKKK